MPKDKKQLSEFQQKYLELSRKMNASELSEEDSERYEKFILYADTVNSLVNACYVKDDNGEYPLIDGEMLFVLRDAYHKALVECDRIIEENANEGIALTMKEVARDMRNILARDNASLNMVDVELQGSMTFEEILEKGRTATVNVQGPFPDITGKVPIKAEGMPGGEWDGYFKKSNNSVMKSEAAVSAVATLIGNDHIVEKAVPMTVLADGKPVTGTFMSKSFGYTIDDNQPDNPIKNLYLNKFDNPEIFGQIADLQVVDFIIGVKRRDPNKIMFNFDANKNAIGIKGVENDNVFPEGDRKFDPDSLGVIRKETADKIRALEREPFMLAMRGYGLSETQLDEAWNRVSRLKQSIARGEAYYEDIPQGSISQGYLRTVPEQDWDKYSMRLLANGNNQFQTVMQIRQEANHVSRLVGNENLNIPKVNATFAGNGIKYAVSNADRMGVDNPETIKIVLDENAAIKTVGDNSSTRIPVSFEGQRGFFTKANYVGMKDQYRYMISKFENDYLINKQPPHPEWLDVFEGIYEYLAQGGEVNPDEQDLTKFGISPERADELLENEEFTNNLSLCITGTRFVPIVMRNGYGAIGATQGGRVDKRNVVMSKLGQMLGTDAIAYATDMQVKQGDTIIEGTYMAEAEGKDYRNIDKDSETAKLGTAVFDGSMALRDIADIQIIDYLSMNFDRNYGNLIYKLSEDGTKCEKVTAIDNETCFGTVKVNHSSFAGRLSIRLDNIKVISETMADSILSVSEEALRKTYGGQGLSKEEIDAAIDRVVDVRNAIRDGKIQIIKDDEWKDKKLTDFAEDFESNLFGRVRQTFHVEIKKDRQNDADEDEVDAEDKPVEIEYTPVQKVDEFSKEVIEKTAEEKEIKETEAAMAESMIERYERVEAGKSYDDAKLIEHMTKFTKMFKDKMSSANYALHGCSQYFTDLKNVINQMDTIAKANQEKVKRGERLTDADTRGFLFQLSGAKDFCNYYISHVDDVMRDNGRISRVQRNRKAMVVDLKNTIKMATTIMQVNQDRREVESRPEGVMYRKLRGRQRALNPEMPDADFKKTVAGIIYLSGLSKNVVKLKKDKKMLNALTETEASRSINEIMNTDAFKEMITPNNKENIINLAQEGTGQKLFTEYVKHTVKKNEADKKKAKTEPARNNQAGIHV